MADAGQRISFRRSLAGRLLLWGILPMVVVSASILVVGATSRYQALRAAAEQMLQDGAELAAARIEDANNNAANLASTLAGAQVAGLLGERRQSLLLLAIVLERTPWCRAVFYAYEPNADGKDADAAASGVPIEARTPAGRFVPRWVRDFTRGGAIRLEALTEPESDPGYALALRRFRQSGTTEVSIGDPHAEGDDRVVDYVAPIEIDGRFFGAAGVERSLRDVDALLQDVAARDRTRAFLVAPSGRVVTAAGEFTGDVVGAEVRATPYAAHLRRALDSPADSTTIERDIDPVTDEEMYFVTAPVGTGRWRLVLARPTSTVTGPIRDEVIQLASVALTGLGVVLAILVALAIRYSRGIASAVRLASRVAEGDLTAEMKMDAPDGSEAAQLGHSLCLMTRQLDRLVSEVKRAAIRLHATATQVAATSAEQERSA
ncbi:MAG: methyl-accepting chemotaxis protein, partial [Phycisphaerae bacterium]|nr:methyl-accepting chemotaxis protein [Phycisphaerae bacterium]